MASRGFYWSLYATTEHLRKYCRVRGCRSNNKYGYCENHRNEGWKQYKQDNPAISAVMVRSGNYPRMLQA